MYTNKKVVDYIIVHGLEGISVLQAAIKNFIIEGWQPIGGVSSFYMEFDIEPGKQTIVFIQAMVKYSDD